MDAMKPTCNDIAGCPIDLILKLSHNTLVVLKPTSPQLALEKFKDMSRAVVFLSLNNGYFWSAKVHGLV